MPSPEFPSLSRLVLTPIKLSYQRLKKMNHFKVLDFQKTHFSEKGLENMPPFSLNQIVKINLLSQIIGFQVNIPFKDSNSDHQFFWEP